MNDNDVAYLFTSFPVNRTQRRVARRYLDGMR